MKIKHKVGFIAMITIVDIFVIIMVVISNDKTNIKNDVSTKTSAHVITSETKENKQISEIAASTTTEEQNKEDNIEETEEEIEQQENENIENVVTEDIKEDNNMMLTNTVDTNENEEQNIVSYDELSLEEKIEALNSGTLALEYSGLYTNSNERLTKSKGALYFNGHRETYYSERVLPGTGLNIPGRHVAEDGTVRDGDGYICVASDLSYLPKGAVLITSLGPAKVYDTGCAYGTIDIYVNW